MLVFPNDFIFNYLNQVPLNLNREYKVHVQNVTLEADVLPGW